MAKPSEKKPKPPARPGQHEAGLAKSPKHDEPKTGNPQIDQLLTQLRTLVPKDVVKTLLEQRDAVPKLVSQLPLTMGVVLSGLRVIASAANSF